MSYKFNYGDSVINLPSALLDNLELADSIDIKTLLCIASEPSFRGENAVELLADRLQCRRDKVEAAIKYWLSVGIISNDGIIISTNAADLTSTTIAADIDKVPQTIKSTDSEEKTEKKPFERETPNYTGDEMQTLLDADNGSRRILLNACQNLFGKVFNITEANRVVAMSDYLNLSDEHILMLFKYCRDREKCSVHYVSSMAYNLYDEGVNTVEKLEVYLKAKENKETLENKLRTLIGCGERLLTPTEKKHLMRWTEEFGFDFDVIKRAFEITCDRISGKSPFAYMNKILENWHDKGYTTLEAVDAAEKAFKESKSKGESYGKFDTDEFYGLALKKTAEILNKDKAAQS